MPQNIVFIDTETGGFDADQQSLLSIGAIITDSAYNILQETELFIKQPVYAVTPSAMKKNKIDLRLADDWPAAQTVKDALVDFLGVPRAVLSGACNDRGLWCIYGKNPNFDVGFLKAFLGADVYRSMFLHFTRDITEMYLGLVDQGVKYLPEHLTLQDLCVALKVPCDDKSFHGALYDARMTVECARAIHALNQQVRAILRKYTKSRSLCSG